MTSYLATWTKGQERREGAEKKRPLGRGAMEDDAEDEADDEEE